MRIFQEIGSPAWVRTRDFSFKGWRVTTTLRGFDEEVRNLGERRAIHSEVTTPGSQGRRVLSTLDAIIPRR